MSSHCVQSYNTDDESTQWLWPLQKVLLRINKQQQMTVICWRKGCHRRRGFDANQRVECLAFVQELVNTEDCVIEFDNPVLSTNYGKLKT